MMGQFIAGEGMPVQDPVLTELEKAINSLIEENIKLKEIIAAYEQATDIGPDELNW